MIINVSEVNEKILITSNENKNIKLEFLSNGSDLNNEKILMFLVKLAAQDDNKLEIQTPDANNSQEVKFIVELLQKFNQTIMEDVHE